MPRILNKDLTRGKLWNRHYYCHNILSWYETTGPTTQPHRLHNCDWKDPGEKESIQLHLYITSIIRTSSPSKRAGIQEALGLLQTPGDPHEDARDQNLLSLELEEAFSAELHQRSQQVSPLYRGQQAQQFWHQLDPKVHCLQNPPCFHSKLPWRLLLLHHWRVLAKGFRCYAPFVQIPLMAACGNQFYSLSSHLFGVRKQRSHFSDFSLCMQRRG